MSDPISLVELYTEIGTMFQDALQSIDPVPPLFLRSAPLPSLENTEEWVSFEMLGMDPSVTPNTYVNQRHDFQITCYSLHAQYRQDKDPLAHFALADLLKPLIDKRTVVIGQSKIEFLEARVINLDLRSMGDFSKAIYQQSPSLKTSSIVILSTGRIIDSQI